VRDPPWSTMLKAPQPAPNKRILVVDDDEITREMLREILTEEGYTVETVNNGRDALEALRLRAPPGVVVLDLMMPVMNGWEVLQEMQQDAALAKIPVVAISASAETRSADGFLSKPVDYHMLLATVGRFVKAAPLVP
jgi:two-component system, OmpR family, response regulator CpxR